MTILLLVGSTGAGKTTMGKALNFLMPFVGYPSRYVEININHGIAYLFTLLLVKVLKYRYISNYYWTLRFRNVRFFCKYLNLMMVLDILYAPVKILASLLFFRLIFKLLRKNKYYFILDEYYFTAIAEYTYHSLNLCKNSPRTLKFFNNIIFRLALTTIKEERVIIVHLLSDLSKSIRASILRDKTTMIDVPHLYYKNLYMKSIMGMLEKHLKDLQIYRIQIADFPADVIKAIKTLLVDIRVK